MGNRGRVRGDICQVCALRSTVRVGKYKNEAGQKYKLCSDCAKKEGTWELLNPCELCPEGDKTDANYKNTEGQKKKLCSDCAKKEGTWEVQHPCELCPEGDKTDAAYKNTEGQKNKLCSDCAKKEGTWEVQHPCELCPEGDKTDAAYKNTEGQKKKLCSDCAKKEGTWELLNPCELCPEGDKTDAAYKNTEGQKYKLCSDCAKKEGTWELRNPCELCPEGDKTDANYKNTEGQKYKLCSSCAVAQGTHYAMVRGASLVACQFFDRLKQHYGEEYPHVHYHMDADGHSTTTGKEVTGLVPGRKIRPDSFIAARNEVWLFHGNYYHGYPPDHPRHERGCGVGDISNKELYDGTLKVMHMYADAGYRVKYAWEHEFREVTRAKLPRRLESVIRAFA